MDSDWNIGFFSFASLVAWVEMYRGLTHLWLDLCVDGSHFLAVTLAEFSFYHHTVVTVVKDLSERSARGSHRRM